MGPRKAGGSRADRAPRESGAIKKPRADRIAVALCYPNRYELAMGNLGFHQVYHLFNSRDEVVCERVTLDGAKPSSIETSAPLSGFEVIAFSISYEADLAGMTQMLAAAGIPLDPVERAKQNSPLVLAGGVMCFLNPEPLAGLADAVAIGEAEAMLGGLVDTLKDHRHSKRGDLLRVLASVPGVYVPSLYRVSYAEDGRIEARESIEAGIPEVVRRQVADTSFGPARTRVFTDSAEFCDMALVELSRGCVNGCRFCTAAYIYRPPRFFPIESIGEALLSGFGERKKAGLIAASATDHPGFSGIREWIRGKGKAHSVASLRLDHVTPELLADIFACGHKTLTVAPEAATERLRAAINKPVSNGKIVSAMKMIGASDIPRLKLYLQVGLPFETKEDIEAVEPFMAMIKASLKCGAGRRNWATALSVSINPFVPKPGTPFQWHPMDQDVKNKIDHLSRRLRRMGGVAVTSAGVREAVFQALLSRGDRRVGQVLAEGLARGKKADWVLKRWPDDLPGLDFYLHRQRDLEEVMPWDFIDHGVDRELLWKEYQRAAEGVVTPPCRPGKCTLCRACDQA